MNQKLRILLIDDDEDDYILTRDLLSETGGGKFRLEWVASYDAGLDTIGKKEHDVYLLDYRLGNHNGLDLLRRAIGDGCKAPIIFLTGQEDYRVDIEAMQAGAADYLLKGQIGASLLERSIRYSIEHKRAEEALRESEKQLRHLSSQILTAQENERKRIAGELHDSIGQCLSAIKFSVESTMEQIGNGVHNTEGLSNVVPLVQRAMDEVRRIMTDLRPSILDDLGILATIGWFSREYGKIYPGIQVLRDMDVPEEEIPESLKIVIFRIVQEALNNIAKYSRAQRAVVTLKKADGEMKLSIEDNGDGFNMTQMLQKQSSGRCFGMTSMRERAELSGGSFSIRTAKGKGTTITTSWAAPAPPG